MTAALSPSLASHSSPWAPHGSNCILVISVILAPSTMPGIQQVLHKCWRNNGSMSLRGQIWARRYGWIASTHLHPLSNLKPELPSQQLPCQHWARSTVSEMVDGMGFLLHFLLKGPFYSTCLRNGCWLGARAFIGNNKSLFRNDFHDLWSIWGLQAIETELSRLGVTGEGPRLILAINMAVLQSPDPWEASPPSHCSQGQAGREATRERGSTQASDLVAWSWAHVFIWQSLGYLPYIVEPLQACTTL